jgi:lipoate---protein ligase
VSPASGWGHRPRRGRAGDLVGDWPPAGARAGRVIGVFQVDGPPALVLGSAQLDTDVDTDVASARGVDVVRRRSGGGSVLVGPGAQVWVELWLPRGDPLWDDDVVAFAGWAGDVWQRALSSLGVSDLEVHRGRAVRTGWSDTVCFAGAGPGEVMASGRKLVGLSQRRTRDGARLSTMALVRWDPGAVVGLLRAGGGVGGAVPVELADAATGLEAVLGAVPGTSAPVTGPVVERALLASLP